MCSCLEDIIEIQSKLYDRKFTINIVFAKKRGCTT